MAKKKGSKGRKQPQIKGFRPGKEPPQLRKQQAKARLGPDAGWAQKQMVEAVGDRTPEEVQGMLRKWALALLLVVVALVVAGIFLYSWTVWAGLVAHALAAVVGFGLYRIRRQSARLLDLAESISGKPSR